MGKILVLAEKPSVGRDLAKVLNCRKSANGYIEGDKYIVTWALGHLVTLADPDAYDDRYKTWSLDYLPMLPKDLKLIVIKDTSRQYKCVKELLYRKDVTEIVIATDAGREGELVARWILEKANVKKPVKRLWISSQTDKAIKEGFNSLKPSSQYDNLFKAAKSRAEADWIVGLNITRALTCKYNAQLSAGRVQSPTLFMIVNRENERINFVAKDYYNIHAKSNGFILKYRDKNNNSNIFEEEKVNKILESTKGKPCKVIDVTENLKKKNSPALYDLTELQRDCNKIFGYSAKQTLSIMQRLYENYKILTYPRTDSRYISQDIVPTIPERLKAISLSTYKQFVDKILEKPINSHKGFVDNSKVSDHHAIIPTEQRISISLLSQEERNVYDLVVKRFLANLLPQNEYIQKNVIADINGETFIAKGNTIKVKGWKQVYERSNDVFDEDDKDTETLPDIKVGDIVPIKAIESVKLKTKPPERFTEATLLSAMENPQKYVTMEKSLAKTLGETGGIGTVATRADIIEKLFNSFYIEKNNKEILPTSKGKQLLNLVPKDLKSPLLTAEWETELELISKGRKDPNQFMSGIKKYTSSLVDDIKKSQHKFIHDNLTGSKCPVCGKYMLEVKGKNGMMYVCQDRECGHRESISRFTNARCPECKVKLELKGKDEGAIYVCPRCSFREKASSFNKRFKDSANALNKKEAQNMMKKIQRENDTATNTALKDALANFKFE